MSFGRPLLLLTLLSIPAFTASWMVLERRRLRYAVRFTNLDVLEQVAGGRARRRIVPSLLFFLALAAVCAATARPAVSRLVPIDRATVILALDASGSMNATDVKPTRLAAAQRAARSFLVRVPPHLRVGLIVFSGEPRVAALPTTNRVPVRDAIDALGTFSGRGGTAIGDALAAAVTLGSRDVVAPPRAGPSDAVSILFLSDGEQTRGNLLPLQGAERARKAGFRVYTVALGTALGELILGEGQVVSVPPDPDTLRAVARLTGGEFFAATSAAKTNRAYAKLGTTLGRTRADRDVTFVFVAAAAVLLLGATGLSIVRSPILP